MRTKTLLPLIVVGILMTSCARKVHFNNQIRETLEAANIPLKSIQFYNDKKLVLRRELAQDETAVESGTVKYKNGKSIHFLILPAETPGVCKKVEDDKLTIVFDSGEGKELEFRNLQGESEKSQYQLFDEGWKVGKNKTKIIYGGKEYSIHQEKRHIKLLIKKGDYNKIKIQKTRMKGVKVRT
jgi:hypothetical protein